MILIFGSKTYGKVDRVPGLFHVCTSFGHLYYLPIIPTGSYLRLEIPGYRDQAIPISFSIKSWLMCWFRTFLGFFGIILTISALTGPGPVSAVPLTLGIIGIFGWLFFGFSSFACNASQESAQRIIDKNGLQDFQEALDIHFDSLNPFGSTNGGFQKDYQHQDYQNQDFQSRNLGSGGDQWMKDHPLTPLDEINPPNR